MAKEEEEKAERGRINRRTTTERIRTNSISSVGSSKQSTKRGDVSGVNSGGDSSSTSRYTGYSRSYSRGEDRSQNSEAALEKAREYRRKRHLDSASSSPEVSRHERISADRLRRLTKLSAGSPSSISDETTSLSRQSSLSSVDQLPSSNSLRGSNSNLNEDFSSSGGGRSQSQHQRSVSPREHLSQTSSQNQSHPQTHSHIETQSQPQSEASQIIHFQKHSPSLLTPSSSTSSSVVPLNNSAEESSVLTLKSSRRKDNLSLELASVALGRHIQVEHTPVPSSGTYKNTKSLPVKQQQKQNTHQQPRQQQASQKVENKDCNSSSIKGRSDNVGNPSGDDSPDTKVQPQEKQPISVNTSSSSSLEIENALPTQKLKLDIPRENSTAGPSNSNIITSPDICTSPTGKQSSKKIRAPPPPSGNPIQAISRSPQHSQSESPINDTQPTPVELIQEQCANVTQKRVLTSVQVSQDQECQSTHKASTPKSPISPTSSTPTRPPRLKKRTSSTENPNISTDSISNAPINTSATNSTNSDYSLDNNEIIQMFPKDEKLDSSSITKQKLNACDILSNNNRSEKNTLENAISTKFQTPSSSSLKKRYAPDPKNVNSKSPDQIAPDNQLQETLVRSEQPLSKISNHLAGNIDTTTLTTLDKNYRVSEERINQVYSSEQEVKKDQSADMMRITQTNATLHESSPSKSISDKNTFKTPTTPPFSKSSLSSSSEMSPVKQPHQHQQHQQEQHLHLDLDSDKISINTEPSDSSDTEGIPPPLPDSAPPPLPSVAPPTSTLKTDGETVDGDELSVEYEIIPDQHQSLDALSQSPSSLLSAPILTLKTSTPQEVSSNSKMIILTEETPSLTSPTSPPTVAELRSTFFGINKKPSSATFGTTSMSGSTTGSEYKSLLVDAIDQDTPTSLDIYFNDLKTEANMKREMSLEEEIKTNDDDTGDSDLSDSDSGLQEGRYDVFSPGEWFL